MSTPRTQLAEQIQTDNPAFRVLDYGHRPANVNPGKPVVTVIRTEMGPGERVLALDHTLQVLAIGSKTDPEAAEDELDDLLDAVCLSVERLKNWRITSCKRASLFEDTFTGWVIDVTCTSENVYRDIVTKENRENG